MEIGVLDIQGDVSEHVSILQSIGVKTRSVRKVSDLEGISGIVMPGGESTVIGSIMSQRGISKGIIERKLPVMGTCAGLILMSKNVEGKEGEDLSTPILKSVGGDIKEFYFITRWPRELKPFYVQPFDDKYSRGFDLQFGEMEITSGAQRVHLPEVLISNLKSKGLNPDSFNFYVNAFRYGMPPHAGWAIGLERLTMVMLDIANIRETTLFPRDRTRITP